MTWRRSFVTTLPARALLVAILASSHRAFADEKAACVAASEKAQQLKSSGKLVEAREQLNVCGRTECPKLIHDLFDVHISTKYTDVCLILSN